MESVLDRARDFLCLWSTTVDPLTELVSSVFHADAFQYGVVPHPGVILVETSSRMLSRTIEVALTSLLIAPSSFPFPWKRYQEEPNQQKKKNNNTAGYFHNMRTLSVLLFLTSRSLLHRNFSKLPTSKLYYRLSRKFSETFVHPVNDLFQYAFGKVLSRFSSLTSSSSSPSSSSPPTLASVFDDNNEKSSLHSAELVDDSTSTNSTETSAAASMTFEDVAYEIYRDSLQDFGPIRVAFARNMIPLLSIFVQEQSVFLSMTLLSKSSKFRRLVIGNLFHKSAVCPYPQVARMHLLSTSITLTDIIGTLVSRMLGCFLGFHASRLSFSLLSSNSNSTSTSSSSSAAAAAVDPMNSKSDFFSVPLFSLYAEQLVYFAYRRTVRPFILKKVAMTLSDFIKDRFPIPDDYVPDCYDEWMYSDKDEEEEEEDEEEEVEADNRSKEEEGGEEKEKEEKSEKQKEQEKKEKEKNRKKKTKKKSARDINEEEFREGQRADVFTPVNYYTVLEVEKAATKSEIKKAYHRAAQRYHPDKLSGPQYSTEQRTEASEKFKLVQKAAEVLQDESLREEYDLAQRAGITSAHNNNSPGGNDAFSSSSFSSSFSAFSAAAAAGVDDGGESDFERGGFSTSYHEQALRHGIPPHVFVQRYFEWVETIPHRSVQNSLLLCSSLGSVVLSGYVIHGHLNNLYQDFMRSGI